MLWLFIIVCAVVAAVVIAFTPERFRPLLGAYLWLWLKWAFFASLTALAVAWLFPGASGGMLIASALVGGAVLTGLQEQVRRA